VPSSDYPVNRRPPVRHARIYTSVSFAPFATDRIRIYITNALGSWTRITEVEAWGN